MLRIRRTYLAALAVGGALAVGAPAANAQVIPGPTLAAWGVPGNLGPIGNNPATAWGPCGTPTGAEGQGGTGGTADQACLNSGVSYIGASIGQITSVVGPTGGPTFVGSQVVSGGNGAAG